MLRFFRYIRQKLLEQQKIRTYALYAIGEIVLVVIGILIALQINNWNEERKGKELQQVYLNNLILDLESQLVELDRHIRGEVYAKASLDRVTSMLNEGFESADLRQYNKDMQSLVITRTLNLHDATFEDLKSTGNLNLITDEILKLNILNYFQTSNRDVYVIRKNSEGWHHAVIQDLLERQLANFDVTGMNERLTTGSPMLKALEVQQFSDEKEELFNQHLRIRLSEIENQLTVKNVLTNRRWAIEVGLLFLHDMEDRTNKLITELKRELH